MVSTPEKAAETTQHLPTIIELAGMFGASGLLLGVFLGAFALYDMLTGKGKKQ